MRGCRLLATYSWRYQKTQVTHEHVCADLARVKCVYLKVCVALRLKTPEGAS